MVQEVVEYIHTCNSLLPPGPAQHLHFASAIHDQLVCLLNNIHLMGLQVDHLAQD